MDTTTHDHGAMMSASTTHNHALMDTTTDPHAMHRTTTHNHGGGDDGGMSHGMMMVMHGGYREVVVFSEWTTTDVGGFVGTCIGLFFIAMAYEGIKFARDRITQMNAINKRMKVQAIHTNNEKGMSIEEHTYNKQLAYTETYWQKLVSADHLIQLFLHVTQFFVSYFLMLAVMTYNSWICMSILIGIGVGFLVFGVRRTKINLEEDCH